MSPCACCAAVLARLAAIDERIERIDDRLARPPETPRAIRMRKRCEAIYRAGELLGRNAEAARKLRRLIVGAAVTHDPALAAIIGQLRRDAECPCSERRLWQLLKYPGGEPEK